MSDGPALFSWGTRLGLVFIVESAFLSIIAVMSLLGFIGVNAYRNIKYRNRPGRTPWNFFRSPVDYYFLALLLFDLSYATGSALNIRWVRQGIVTPGHLCTAQSLLKEYGDVGAALASLAIAIHTFLVLYYRWQAPRTRWLPLGVIALILTFLIGSSVTASQLHKDPPFYGPTTYWCWIPSKYRGQQLGMEYGVFWFTALANILLYVPLFFVLRQNLGADARNEAATAARQMLAYPIVYIFLVLPISVARWLEFTRPDSAIPSEAVAFGGTVFALSGVVNVSLYVMSRPAVRRSIFGRRTGDEPTPAGAMADGVTMLSFASPRRASAGGLDDAESVVCASPRARVTGTPMLADDDEEDESDFVAEKQRHGTGRALR